MARALHEFRGTSSHNDEPHAYVFQGLGCSERMKATMLWLVVVMLDAARQLLYPDLLGQKYPSQPAECPFGHLRACRGDVGSCLHGTVSECWEHGIDSKQAGRRQYNGKVSAAAPVLLGACGTDAMDAYHLPHRAVVPRKGDRADQGRLTEEGPRDGSRLGRISLGFHLAILLGLASAELRAGRIADA